MGSGHQFQGDVSPTPTNNSQTPTWCPTIQPMADTPDSIWSHTEGSVLQECPYAPLQRPTTSLSHQLGFWLTAYRSEVLMTPFLALIILLEWLTKLIKTFCTLCYQFIMKGYNSEAARCERCTERSRGEGVELPCPPSALPTSPGVPQPWRSPNSSLWVWTSQSRLHYTDTIDGIVGHWFLNSICPSVSPGGQRAGT